MGGRERAMVGGSLCNKLMHSAEKGDWRWSQFGMKQDGITRS